MKYLRRLVLSAGAGLCFLLSACGGGGSGQASTAPSPEPVPVAAAQSTSPYDNDVAPTPAVALAIDSTPVADDANATARAVSLAAARRSYTIGGSLSGLASGTTVTLLNNNRDPITLSANSSFAFAQPVLASYNVTVRTQPKGQICTVGSGRGVALSTDIQDVQVICSATSFTVSGTVSGLAAAASLVLRNNGADALVVKANGAFTFRTPVAANSAYSVTVDGQPLGQTCTVNNHAGESVDSNISDIDVQCSTRTFPLNVVVRGLASWASVTLQNGDTDSMLVKANGSYVFDTRIAYKSNYTVTVGTQPVGQICTAFRNTGVAVTTNIPSVVVTCATKTYKVGGTVSGLVGSVSLRNNAGRPLIVADNGSFAFPTHIAHNSNYLVTVSTQPKGQICSVTNGSGSGITSDITQVSVSCSARTLAIGGTLSGLAADTQVTLFNNGADALKLTANGLFKFSTPVVYGGSYVVTVGSQPVGQMCTVSRASGSGITSAISSILVRCASSSSTYAIGGSITGLATGKQVTLLNNGDDPLILSANGTFSFANKVAVNSSYSVTVGTQPVGQVCTVSNANGAAAATDISSVTVVCSTLTYKVSGTLTGSLALGSQITLLNNGGDALTLKSPGPFSFATPVAYNGSYAVTVSTQPANQPECTVTNGSGKNVVADISNVVLACTLAPPVTPQFAYVANYLSGNVSQFAIGPDGSLSPLSVATVAAGTSPYQVVYNNGAVYVVNQGVSGGMGSVSQYRITPDGTLASMSPASVSSLGEFASAMAISPDGKYAYVANERGKTIVQFSISTGGQLNSMPAATVVAGGPLALSIAPGGKYLYATGGRVSSGSSNQGVEVFAIGSNGALSRVGTSGLLSNFFSFGLAMDPGGSYLYATNWAESTVAQFSINSTSGLLTALTPATVSTVSIPIGIAVHPNGLYVYVPNSQGQNTKISQYAVGAGGALSTLTPLTLSQARDGLRGISFDRTGQYAYITAATKPGYVLQFKVGSDGSLTQIAGDLAAGDLPYSVTTGYWVALPD